MTIINIIYSINVILSLRVLFLRGYSFILNPSDDNCGIIKFTTLILQS